MEKYVFVYFSKILSCLDVFWTVFYGLMHIYIYIYIYIYKNGNQMNEQTIKLIF